MIAGRDWSGVIVVGVSRLANYLKRKLEADPKLTALGVKGEVSNLRVQSSGSWNFDVKDRDAVLGCFAFPSDAATFPAVRNGDAIVVYGRVSTFEKRSTYQLVVRHLEHEGVGALYARFDELRKKLEAEGLFGEDRKRRLPRFPFRVALVGSASGDGTRDFIAQARARAPHVAIELVETPVQGDVAPQIVAALRRACAMRPDLVVVARGGGSFEDLFVFNDERVVRTVAACPVPVVSAIGHESNTSLVDYAADQRASTPSTAAQTVLPPRAELLRELRRDDERLRRALATRIERARARLERIEHRSPLADPRLLLANRRQRLDAAAAAVGRAAERALQRRRTELSALSRTLVSLSPAALLSSRKERFGHVRVRLKPVTAAILRGKRDQRDELASRLDTAMQRIVERAARRIELAKTQLAAVDPHGPLRRGYAIVANEHGRVVRDPVEAPPGTRLRVTLARGELAARVETANPGGGEQIGLF